MNVTTKIRELILNSISADQIATVAISEGMRPLREDGIQKVIDGSTSIDEVLRLSGGSA